jgi:HEPN domain-containing protein
MPPRQFDKSQGYDSVDLLQYASGHFVSAQALFSTSAFCFDSAGYLAHVAVELMLKATILHTTGGFPGEHSLQALLEASSATGHPFHLPSSHEGTLYLLDNFQDCRYPRPSAPIQIGYSDCTPIVALWDQLTIQLPLSLKEAWQTADSFNKGGRVLMIPSRPPDSPSDGFVRPYP